MSETTCGQRESCHVCGSSKWREAVFANGRITCKPCHDAILASKPKPAPTGQQTFIEWIAPQPLRGVKHD
jgi:hypothetical protein